MSRFEPETPPEAPARQHSGLHPVNVGHLVMGVAFLGLALVWLLLAGDVIEVEHHGWVLGTPWLVAGAVGIGATVLRHRRTLP